MFSPDYYRKQAKVYERLADLCSNEELVKLLRAKADDYRHRAEPGDDEVSANAERPASDQAMPQR